MLQGLSGVTVQPTNALIALRKASTTLTVEWTESSQVTAAELLLFSEYLETWISWGSQRQSGRKLKVREDRWICPGAWEPFSTGSRSKIKFYHVT